MENEIQKFDPSTLMQGVKDRIKATFVSLIPDDQWEVMVKREVDDFFVKREDNSYNYNNRGEITPFQRIIRNEISDVCAKRTKDYLNTPQFNQTFDEKGNPLIAEVVEKVIVENSGAILLNLVGKTITQALQQVKYDIQSGNFKNW